jgi:glycosyltransferase involved in cell wall biosynthesis
MTARVSIIMPAYNAAGYIGEVLASIAAQTLADWELIVVDDGSTDDTLARLAQAPFEARRQVFSQANAGSASARNRGLAAAQGEYAAFLDVDDGWHPNFLSHMVAALDAAPAFSAAYCGWQYCDEAGQLLPQVVPASAAEAAELRSSLLWRNSIMPSCLVARRQMVTTLGGFDTMLPSCEDWDLWLRLIQYGPFVAVPEVLTRYRAHAGSKTEHVAVVEAASLKLYAKHLGPLEGSPESWPPDRRRAVGYTYFNAALGYFRQNNMAEAATKIAQAVQCWPGLLDLDEFYYELGCAKQPRGRRGAAEGLDLSAGAALIHERLFDPAAALPPRARQQHWGHALLVLARLGRDAGQAGQARAFALRAAAQGTPSDRLAAARLWLRSLAPQALVQARQRGRTASP